jgi:5-methylcytosine-specific restriction endonuclease McrA
MTKDHFEPRVYGGPTVFENMIAACCQCNNLRGELDAFAFYNLMCKWLKRDPTLWERWYSLTRSELRTLKEQCHTVHERQLNGLAFRHIEYAFRHFHFTKRERYRTRRA